MQIVDRRLCALLDSELKPWQGLSHERGSCKSLSQDTCMNDLKAAQKVTDFGSVKWQSC